MENTRIGKSEAIALIFTIMVNHAILNISKSIITSTQSSSLLNTIYISIIAIFLSYIIYLLLKKFPTFDILDISNYLGGKFLKSIVGILFFAYFIFFSATLLKNFAYCLQIIYYPNTNSFFIILPFIIAAVFVCNLKYNAIYRSNLLTIPLVISSISLVFLGNVSDFTFQNVFPVLGNGISETFLVGISNLFAFQGLLYIFFLPPNLKDVTELKKITLLSILFSTLYLIVSVAIILLLFDIEVTNTLLMPLYSAVRYIEFGSFFQRLDSVFILIWIISFVSYLGITINTCTNIFKKVTSTKSYKFSTILVSFLILVCTFFSTTYAVSTFFTDVVYKYTFFIMLGISVAIILVAYLFKYLKHKRIPKIVHVKRRCSMISKILRTLLIVASIFAFIWGFSDSYSSHTLDNIVHVVAIGIDKSENSNENIKVSFQFVNVSANGGQGSSGGETSTVVTSINSSTLNKSINLMNSYIGKELNFSHCKVIVFSEDFAKEGITTEIYALINNEEFRPSTNIVISTSDANSYLKNANPNIEKLVTNYYDTFELTSNFTGYSDDITLGRFYNNLFTSSNANTAILGRTFKKTSDSGENSQEGSGSSQSSAQGSSSSPNGESAGESSGSSNEQSDSGGASLEISGQRGTQNVGIAVLNDGKYIGELSEMESICHLLVTNNVDSFVLSIPMENYPDNLLDLNVSPIRNSTIKIDTSSDSPNISVSIYCEGKILTISENYDYANSETLKDISSHAERYLMQSIENYLNKTSKELNSDIAGFSQYAIPHFLTLPEWDNYNWASKYPNSNFTVDVNFDVTSSLLFSGNQ